MNKIVGFTISKNEIQHNDVDIFNSGITLVSFSKLGYNIYLWGIGELKKCIVNGAYTMAFPLSNNLLDRNTLITVNDDRILIENDWLGTIPIFYNLKDKIISTLSLKVLTNNNINQRGLRNYLKYGYSVFQETMYKDVSFLRYYSKIDVTKNNIKIEYKNDPAKSLELFKETTNEKEVISLIDKYINSVETNTKGDIIIPTSGGFDSRLLNIFVKDKTRIKSYTYGISSNQKKSREVVYAKKLAELLNTKWEQIEISSFYKYIPQWYKLFGFSTHLHGMYHIQFYEQIFKSIIQGGKHTLLSGIIGDGWSGNILYPNINSVDKIFNLGYTHGMSIEEQKILNLDSYAERALFEENKEALSNKGFALIMSMRMKIMLLQYLTCLPEYFGIQVWTPFLNFDIVIKMLNIPEKRWKKRMWQVDFFKSKNLWLEEMNLKWSKSNRLNFIAASQYNFPMLKKEVFNGIIDNKHIDHINKILNKQSIKSIYTNKLLTTPIIKEVLKRLGFKDHYIKALCEYLVLKSIELSINQKEVND